MKAINPTYTNSWKKLLELSKSDFSLRKLFEEKDRASLFSVESPFYLLDYSKQLINKEVFQTLLELAKECQLEDAIESYFKGAKINKTEYRAVLHTALRSPNKNSFTIDGVDLNQKIKTTLEHIEVISNQIINGEWKGLSGKRITDIVNIGIGGSDLGPKMVVNALKEYQNQLNVHFVSNVDPTHLEDTTQNLDLETTVFIIASKSFTTQETLTNAEYIKSIYLKKYAIDQIASHFIALSANTQKAIEFGIPKTQILELWDWVGGRFSVWSAIGLSVSLAIGFQNYQSFLDGAFQMDEHFKNQSFEKNLPIILALIGIWNNNFLQYNQLAVVPYAQRLDLFIKYLQQVDMESNGKTVDRNGYFIDYSSGPIIFGNAGTDGQHAYFQHIHQGSGTIPIDFIVFAQRTNSSQESKIGHKRLLANCLAQSKALAFGKFAEECDLLSYKYVNHKVFKGNTPSNTLLGKRLTPESLGYLMAMYEHKTFVQGIIWNIFSFDQWGVQLGKEIATIIEKELKETVKRHTFDGSTNHLLRTIKKYNYND